jgi:hypothetical protein
MAAAAALLAFSHGVARGQDELVAAAANPDPKRLPALSFQVRYLPSAGSRKPHPTVVGDFPTGPGLRFDSWCYESGWLEYLDARAAGGGALEFRHRVRDYPRVIIVTTATPQPGALELRARAEVQDGPGDLPAELRSPNVCFQMVRNPAFTSNPGPYAEFARRCFIFTEHGQTFLDKTRRKPSPLVPADHPQNNPPWVQMYSAPWRRPPEDRALWSWPLPPLWIAAHSPDHYETPVIGVVSRDGKYLVAVGNGSADTMLQAFHDCLHNNPAWLPRALPAVRRTWRMKIYVMENDAPALLRRVSRDFPGRDQP